MAKLVEAIENFTKPDVLIHIDLPTYYMPVSPTRDVGTYNSTQSWSEQIIRYLSNMTVLEFTKPGLMKYDAIFNLTDGVDKVVNASKVFSDAGRTRFANIRTMAAKSRFARRAKSTNNLSTKQMMQGSFVYDQNRKRTTARSILNFFPNIQDKLKYYARNIPTKMGTTTPVSKTSKVSNTTQAVTTSETIVDVSKSNREAEDDKLTDEDYLILDYDVNELKDEIMKKKTPYKVSDPIKSKEPNNTKKMIKSGNDVVYVEPHHEYANYDIPSIHIKSKESEKVTALIKTEHENKDIPYKNIHMKPLKKTEYFRSTKFLGNDKIHTTFKINTTTKIHNVKGTRFGKRDVQSQNTFTAKDVAALEVIVDLMKNPLYLEDKDTISYDSIQQRRTNAVKLQPNTNSIQVHIAIPYAIECDRKRSADPLKVRRVFVAKMNTPVDLEYQVQSFEGFSEVPTTERSLSPGMYLIVENSNKSNGNFALKSIKSNIVIRELDATQPMNTPTLTQKVDTTSPKIMGRVTLSKDFIAAVNKELMAIYDNSVSKSTVHSIKVRKTEEEITKKVKRKINWETIKKFFGRDKVLTCHCKANSTLCEACAASDLVMRDLLFEFDNLARYMHDHCKEIQTYFWMNPSGGRKLRDSVHKIDSALYDYYKRVKGKCQGRTCKTFSTYIDKRTSMNLKPDNGLTNYTEEQLLDDIESLASNIENATRLNIIPNKTLKKRGKDFVKAFQTCLTTKSLSKRSEFDPHKKKNMKSVYSLDNINVNLICKPDSHSQFKDYSLSSPAFLTESSTFDLTEPTTITVESYDDDEVKQNRRKNKLTFLLSRIKMKKLTSTTTSYPKEVINKILTCHRKREAKLSQIEAPLIADAGGTFWYDYLSKGKQVNFKESVKPNIEIYSNKAIHPSPMKTTAIQIYPFTAKEKLKNTKHNFVRLTVKPGTQRHTVQRNDHNTVKPELLSYNMNELFKLFDQLPDVAEVRNLSTETTRLIKEKKTRKHKTKITTSKHIKTHKAKTKKMKTAKTTVERKLLKHKPHKTVTPINIANETKITEKFKTDSDLPLEIETKAQKEFESINIKQKNIIKKIKSVTSDILNNLENKMKFFTKCTNTTVSDRLRLIRTVLNSTETKRSLKNVDSEMTTATNPTIFIIDVNANQDSDTTELKGNDNNSENDEISHENARNLLLSILKYEKDSIANEWKRLAITDAANSKDDLDDLTLIDLPVTPASQSRNSKKDKTEVEDASGDCCLIDKLKQLEKPVPRGNREEKPKKGKVKQLMNQLKVFVVSDAKKAGHKEVKTRFLREKMSVSSKSLKKEKTLSNTVMVNGLPADPSSIIEDKNFINQTKSALEDTTEIKRLKSSVTEISRYISPTLAKIVTSTEVYRFSMLNSTPKAKKNEPKKSGEAYDPTTTQVCDIHATLDHVLTMRKTLQKKQFEDFVKKLKCHKYKRTPKHFLVELPRRRRQFRRNFDPNSRYDMGLITPKNTIKWDWIRNKRSLLNFDDNNDDAKAVDDCGTANKEFDDSIDDFKEDYGVESLSDVNIVEKGSNTDFGDDFFEMYFKDDDDVYRTRKKKRRKRTAVDMKELVSGLRNLPPLRPPLNEIYAMAGDNILIECLPKARYSLRVDQDVTWKTDRSAMLKYDNVIVSGLTVFVRKVEPRNVGNYSCVKGATVHRNVRLTVITVPMFNVVFIPMYSSKEQCSYDDLKALQHLGPVMSQLTCSCKDHKSIAIEEPICLRDEQDGTTKLRATAVLTTCPYPDVKCSAQCKRDLQCSIALLCATNAHVLSSIQVVISKDGENKSLTPSYKRSRKAIVTHTLRKKDHTSHVEYHRLAASMNPGNVDIVVACPKGHYLISSLKICLVCPADAYSGEGENACFTCALGSAAEPGADRCKLSIARMRTRRYDWCWPPCGYAILSGAVVAASACVCACLLCARVTSRGTCRPPLVVGRVESLWAWGRRETATKLSKTCSSSIHTRSPRRPISPSRVLLARLFRGSQTSSRATDSHENKFEQWKEKNIPPPLPPIDFDLN